MCMWWWSKAPAPALEYAEQCMSLLGMPSQVSINMDVGVAAGREGGGGTEYKEVTWTGVQRSVLLGSLALPKSEGRVNHTLP